MSIQYFRDELIDILKKRDFSKLAFRKLDNGFPYAYCILFLRPAHPLMKTKHLRMAHPILSKFPFTPLTIRFLTKQRTV